MKLMKIGKTLTQVLKILCLIGVALCLAAAVVSLINPQWLLERGTFTVNDIEISKPLEQLKNPALPMFLIFLTGAIIGAIMFWMMHRIHGIILEAMAGKPFQPCTVQWMRQIGYCAIALPFVGCVMSLIAMLVKAEGIYARLDLSGVLTGIVVLCLTQVFAYGAELEKDVEGLL